jgi:cytochrome c
LIYINGSRVFQALNRAEDRIIGANEEREPRMRMLIIAAAMLAMGAAQAQNVDVPAAEALTKKSGCMKCHSVTAKKDGPSFKETAAKYKGKPNAEAALYKHLTTGPTIKIDGKEERHEIIKSKNDAEIKNVIAYILSR